MKVVLIKVRVENDLSIRTFYYDRGIFLILVSLFTKHATNADLCNFIQ